MRFTRFLRRRLTINNDVTHMRAASRLRIDGSFTRVRSRCL